MSSAEDVGNTRPVPKLPTWEEARAAINRREFTLLDSFIYQWQPESAFSEYTVAWREDLAALIRDICDARDQHRGV
jgi:hypothetical protein